jgi:quercetin dioxygenase-like cupin family protein
MADGPDFTYFSNVAALVADAEEGTITSRVIYKDDRLNVTVFAFAAGQGLSEHTASRPAVLHFLSGEARLTLGAETQQAGPGTWVRMRPNLPHSVEAATPVKMLLLLL